MMRANCADKMRQIPANTLSRNVCYNNSEIVWGKDSKGLPLLQSPQHTDSNGGRFVAIAAQVRHGLSANGEEEANKSELCGIVRHGAGRPRIFQCAVCGRVFPGYRTLPGGGWRPAKHGRYDEPCPGYDQPAIITDPVVFAKSYPPEPDYLAQIVDPLDRRLAVVAQKHSRAGTTREGMGELLHVCVLNYLADLAEIASIHSDGGGI